MAYGDEVIDGTQGSLAEMIAHRVDVQSNPTIAFLARGIEGLYVRMTAKAPTEAIAEAAVKATAKAPAKATAKKPTKAGAEAPASAPARPPAKAGARAVKAAGGNVGSGSSPGGTDAPEVKTAKKSPSGSRARKAAGG